MANTTDQKFTRASEQTSAILNAMAEDMRASVLGEGMTALLQPIVVAAKRFAKRSERTGALRASITSKTITYKTTGIAVGLVGPDRAYYAGGRKVGPLGALLGAERPANIAHLVEYGHHAVKPRKGKTRRKKNAVVTGWVPAKPFLRPAAITTTAEQSEAFFNAVARGMDAAFARGSSKAA